MRNLIIFIGIPSLIIRIILTIKATQEDTIGGKSKRYPLGIILLCVLESCAGSDDLTEGRRAYDRGDYISALNHFQPLAQKQGNADAQFYLGRMYADGHGVETDFRLVAKWFTTAEQEHADAQFFLGEMYYSGDGVEKDYQEAVKWYTEAAQQEHTDAQNSLGFMYDYGRGVERNNREAFLWYTKAAQQGLAKAQYNLGVMYHYGNGVVQDYSEAVKWYMKAAQKKHRAAMYALGMRYWKGVGVVQNNMTAHFWFNLTAAQGDEYAREDRDRVAKQMTPAQITKAQRLARDWKPAKTTQ